MAASEAEVEVEEGALAVEVEVAIGDLAVEAEAASGTDLAEEDGMSHVTPVGMLVVHSTARCEGCRVCNRDFCHDNWKRFLSCNRLSCALEECQTYLLGFGGYKNLWTLEQAVDGPLLFVLRIEREVWKPVKSTSRDGKGWRTPPEDCELCSLDSRELAPHHRLRSLECERLGPRVRCV